MINCCLIPFSWILCSYQKALDAKKERSSKQAQSYGAKNRQGGHPQQVRTIRIHAQVLNVEEEDHFTSLY